MNSYIRITRRPYEEPYHLNLVIDASNGRLGASLEYYANANVFNEWADALESFPKHSGAVYLWEIGSEKPEDRCACYFRFRVFTTDRLGHCAIQLRTCNNSSLPTFELAEFCIPSEAHGINRLGALCRQFALLKHEVLEWRVSDGELYETEAEAEQAIPADRGERRRSCWMAALGVSMSTFGKWEYTCDHEATANVYSTMERGDSETCTCNGCRNFVAARDKVFPSEFLSLLASLGIDSRKDGEVYHNGKLAPGCHDYGGWFHFIGTLESTGDFPMIAMGGNFTACMLRKCAPALSALNGHPLVQIEFHASNVPWVLSEPEDL